MFISCYGWLHGKQQQNKQVYRAVCFCRTNLWRSWALVSKHCGPLWVLLTYILLNGYDSITHEIFIVLPKCLVPTHSSAWTWGFLEPHAARSRGHARDKQRVDMVPTHSSAWAWGFLEPHAARSRGHNRDKQRVDNVPIHSSAGTWGFLEPHAARSRGHKPEPSNA